ncbi:hypothetical protein GMD78_09980 [Ornithinibacillus sp. L9]|uniref:Uncharacterized protein n=1 Tax=Ornithinibacillus caprae TaxID=2678566 RepID=A0A6N8FGM7_9BACI|nr:hypothetical protein [Ornithinibacillus caprae]MUK88720.1 hypothetical protein [Ornithinibacillus caprae]
MIRYSWRSVKNNFWSSFLVMCSLIAIFIAGPVSISALFDIQAKVDDNIQVYARGSYDILIRSSNSKTEV